jgi:hypothetical protein
LARSSCDSVSDDSINDNLVNTNVGAAGVSATRAQVDTGASTAMVTTSAAGKSGVNKKRTYVSWGVRFSQLAA